jgi:hypothetical protein
MFRLPCRVRAARGASNQQGPEKHIRNNGLKWDFDYCRSRTRTTTDCRCSLLESKQIRPGFTAVEPGMSKSRARLRPSDSPPAGPSLLRFNRSLEPLGPLCQRGKEAAQPLARLFIHEVARLRVELLAREGDEHLRLGHHVGRGVQEYLPQHHLSPSGPAPSRARPYEPDWLVTEGRRVVTRTQTPV